MTRERGYLVVAGVVVLAANLLFFCVVALLPATGSMPDVRYSRTSEPTPPAVEPVETPQTVPILDERIGFFVSILDSKTGESVEGATCYLRKEYFRWPRIPAFSFDGCEVEFLIETGGIFSLDICHPKYDDVTYPVVMLKPGKRNEMTVRLQRKNPGAPADAYIEGLITSSTGKPIYFATIKWSTGPNDLFAGEATSADDGFYRIIVPAGREIEVCFSKPVYNGRSIDAINIIPSCVRMENITLYEECEIPPSAVVQGTVRSASTGFPVEGVNVRLYDESDSIFIGVRTDVEGRYDLTTRLRGIYRIKTEKDGYSPYESDAIEFTGIVELNIYIKPKPPEKPATIVGSVKKASSGVPVEEVEISGPNDVRCETDTSGIFTMVTESGHRTFTVKREGFETATFAVHLIRNKITQVDFPILELDSIIDGRITNLHDGTPVISAEIELRFYDSRRNVVSSDCESHEDWSNYDGRFNLTVPHGTYRLFCHASGFRDAEIDKLVVAEKSDNAITVQLVPKDAKIAGRIYDDKTGEPVLSDSLFVYVESATPEYTDDLFSPGNTPLADVQSDSGYRKDVAAGTYIIKCSAPGYGLYRKRISVSKGENLNYDIELEPFRGKTATISGILVEVGTDSGEIGCLSTIPFPVSAYRDGVEIGWTLTDYFGHFRMMLEPGKTIVKPALPLKNSSKGSEVEINLTAGQDYLINLRTIHVDGE